jgi:hypothetical protein
VLRPIALLAFGLLKVIVILVPVVDLRGPVEYASS